MTTTKTLTYTSFVFALLLLPLASAHLIGGNGIGSGLVHPFTGIDHLLAMVAVGIISVRIGGRALWMVPLTFVTAMVVGGVLAYASIPLPGVEIAVALSVIVLGIAIASAWRTKTGVALACVALFAVFHGHAHGEELITITNATAYTVGFVASTALLHMLGIAIGYGAAKTRLTSTLLRYSGVVMSIVGIAFLSAAL